MQLNHLHHDQRVCRPSQLAFRKHSINSSAKRSPVAAAASEESRESISSLDEESRLEALERGVRKRQGESAQSIPYPEFRNSTAVMRKVAAEEASFLALIPVSQAV